MSKVIVDMAISLDGCIATREGEDGGLHDYFFSPSGDTAGIVREGILTTGAIITDGVESAIRLARVAAAGRDVVIGGGADVAGQFLDAGLVDELSLHVVPKLLGDGMRLFDSRARRVTLTLARAVAAPDALHVVYRVSR